MALRHNGRFKTVPTNTEPIHSQIQLGIIIDAHRGRGAEVGGGRVNIIPPQANFKTLVN
jgi:hypothetical protein